MSERVDMNLCNDVPGRKDETTCLLSSVSACLKSNAAMTNRDVWVTEYGMGGWCVAPEKEVWVQRKKKKQAQKRGKEQSHRAKFYLKL